MVPKIDRSPIQIHTTYLSEISDNLYSDLKNINQINSTGPKPHPARQLDTLNLDDLQSSAADPSHFRPPWAAEMFSDLCRDVRPPLHSFEHLLH